MTATNRPTELYEQTLQFWFGSPDKATIVAKRQSRLWWEKSAAADAEIRERFAELRERAINGELDAWLQNPRGRLALIILVDQMSRNMFREQPAAFAFDFQAQEWCLDGLDADMHLALQPIERVFFYLPLEHSESRVDQARCVALFAELQQQVAPDERELFGQYLQFAERHRDIIERFGRFPHRNRILGRASSAEEEAFLTQPNSSF